MVLSSVNQYPTAGLAGLLIGPPLHDADSLINARDNVAGVTDVTAVPPGGSTTYTILIGGITIAVTTAGDATAVATAFAAAIAANTFTNALVSAAVVGTAVRITERTPANGQVAITESDANVSTPVVVTAHQQVEPMRAGIFVSKQTDESSGISASKGCRLPATGDVLATLAGVVIHTPSRPLDERYPLADEIVYAPGDTVPVLKRGRIWVRTEQAATKLSAVHVRITASGVNTILGNVRVDTDSGNAIAAANCQFAGSAGAGELVELIVNMP